MFITQNREKIKYILQAFQQYNISAWPTVEEGIDRFLQNEIDMERGWQEIADYEKECQHSNNRLLKVIRKIKGRVFYKYLMEIIEESEGMDGKAEIVRAPEGAFQAEKYGRSIPGIWVDQWNVGMTGDSFHGIVCVQLKKDRFLKFCYSM